MTQLGVLLLPPGWDASPSQVTPPWNYESKVSFLRIQRSAPARDRLLDPKCSALIVRLLRLSNLTHTNGYGFNMKKTLTQRKGSLNVNPTSSTHNSF